MRTNWNVGNGKLDGFNLEIFKVGSSPPLPPRASPSLELSSTADSCRRLEDESHNCENPSLCFHWAKCVISLRCQKEVVGVSFPEPLGKEAWFPVGWEPACIRDDLTEPVQAHIPGAACAQFSVTVFSLKFVSSLLARPSDDGREWKQTHPEKL